MNDYVDELLNEQNNVNGLILEILTSGYEEWDFIIAVEGPADKSFYFDFLHLALDRAEMHLLDCGGKSSLLKFKEAAEKYPWVCPPNFRYLCDKDFDDYLGLEHDGIWKTKWYSIESYLVKPEYVDYNVAKFAKGRLSVKQRQLFVQNYWNLFLSMASDVRSYCAFMCEIRANGEHPQFDEFGIEKLFDLTQQDAPRRRGIKSEAIATFDLQRPVLANATLRRAKCFDISDVLKWLRGKLALQIARKCYDRALRRTSPDKRNLIPPPTFLGGDALNTACLYWKKLDGLEEYCN